MIPFNLFIMRNGKMHGAQRTRLQKFWFILGQSRSVRLAINNINHKLLLRKWQYFWNFSEERSALRLTYVNYLTMNWHVDAWQNFSVMYKEIGLVMWGCIHLDSTRVRKSSLCCIQNNVSSKIIIKEAIEQNIFCKEIVTEFIEMLCAILLMLPLLKSKCILQN